MLFSVIAKADFVIGSKVVGNCNVAFAKCIFTSSIFIRVVGFALCARKCFCRMTGDKKKKGIVFPVIVIFGGFIFGLIVCLVVILVHGLMSDRGDLSQFCQISF